MKTMDGLKSCPFCGGKARRYVSVKNLVRVYCPSSNPFSVHPCTDFYEKQKYADEAWNRRTNNATHHISIYNSSPLRISVPCFVG